MTPFNPLFIFSVLNLSLAALGQQISLVTPPSVVQCADVPIQWSGGIGPFTVTIATTDNASLSSVEVIPVERGSSYTWSEDLPAGTPFTISLADSTGNSAITPTLTVQDSTNTSCLQSGSVPPPASSRIGQSHSSKPLSTSIQTSTGTSISSSDTGSPTPSSSHGSSSSNSKVPIIAGVVAGILVLLSVIAILIILQRRKNRRHHTSSRDELVRTFGRHKAGLDGTADDDVDDMAIPEPYVYGAVSRAQSAHVGLLEPGNPSRSGATTPRSSESSRTLPPTLASRKGERYLPEDAAPPHDTISAGASQSRIQEEDIDRLAARMVAMMSAGRLGDQSWSPEARGPRNKSDVLGDDLPAPPPLYRDVARRSSGGQPPNGGRY